jgi:hypothetical protein
VCYIAQGKILPEGRVNGHGLSCRCIPDLAVVEHGLALLKKGQSWRVKSGEKVQIWRDPWIPRPPSFKPSLKKGRARLRWVSQLMKPGTYEWDEQVINSCLYPHDAKEVLNIRLTHRAEEDIIAWYYERSGIFSVKSAYKLALAEDLAEKCQTGSSAKLDGSRTLYNEIWSTRVLAKVKIFAWRLSQEGLATDGAYCHRTGKASVGVVASDNNDGVPLSASRTIHHCGSPEEAEAEALLEGLRLASEWLRNLPVYAESDCSNLVRGCTRGWR